MYKEAQSMLELKCLSIPVKNPFGTLPKATEDTSDHSKTIKIQTSHRSWYRSIFQIPGLSWRAWAAKNSHNTCFIWILLVVAKSFFRCRKWRLFSIQSCDELLFPFSLLQVQSIVYLETDESRGRALLLQWGDLGTFQESPHSLLSKRKW